MNGNEEFFLSIIVPVYRVEKYLRDCVNSIIQQRYKKVELILVDDGSDDACPQICDDYAKTDDMIKVVHKENGGLSSARNAGTQIAKGEYIWFVDADDWICRDCIKDVFYKLEKYSPEILMFDAKIVNETESKICSEIYVRQGKIKTDFLFSGKKFFQNYYLKDAYRSSVCLNIFSRKYINSQQLLFLVNYAHEDEDFTFRSFVLAEKIMYMDRKLYIRRYRQNSIMTSGIYKKNIIDFFEIMKNNTLFIQNIKDEIFQKVYKIYLYERISLLINRIELSDIDDKNYWYKSVEEYFCKYILSEGQRNLSNYLLALEVLIHVREVAERTENIEAFDQEIKTQIFSDWCKGIEDKIKKCIEENIGLNVGIYGTGKHTKWLFPILKKIVSEKKINLVFIDSNKESYTEQFEGYDVINVKDINQKTIVIISSFFKQEEIYEAIRKLNIPCTIIKIYE